MQKITRDLIAHMRDEGYLDRLNTAKLYRDGKLDYDRNKFITKHAPFDAEHDTKDIVYDTDIETLAIQILQMVHYGHIIYKDENDVSIRNNKMITE